ncbi:MAG TPA: glycoside hydrolase family 16 protein, partial [Bacillota bacterium]|nr:glycoside hydrolase family 16 protein [Bacillota bacterium]
MAALALALSRAVASSSAGADWKLVFADEFDGGSTALDANWEFQNGPSGHILCSRWRENAVVSNGVVRLLNRKEQRAGQAWTSGSCWTRRQFKYGYFECRYRYGAATGLNNSFWIMDRLPKGASGKFEIDINEGHYPNEVAMNIHRWSGKHLSHSKKWSAAGRNLATEFHTYGLLWTEQELAWFFDGREIRRETNAFCHAQASVWLSSAIIKWAGEVTDQIDGTAMEVDYVRVYQTQIDSAATPTAPVEYDFHAMLQPVPLTAKWADTNYNIW